jgi:MFS family permease
MLFINAAGIGAISAVGVTAMLGITPAAIRGQVIALYYMAISLAGLLLGPPTVGMLSTRVFGEANIGYAIAAVPVLYGLIPLLFAPAIVRRYRARAGTV